MNLATKLLRGCTLVALTSLTLFHATQWPAIPSNVYADEDVTAPAQPDRTPEARSAPEANQNDVPWAERTFPKWRFAISCPTAWVEGDQPSGVRFRFGKERSGGLSSIQVWWTRKQLPDAAERLAAQAKQSGWTILQKSAAAIDGRDAFTLVCDVHHKAESGRPSLTVRQLLCLVDEPHATYLIVYGDEKSSFDQKLGERFVGSFRRSEPSLGRQSQTETGANATGSGHEPSQEEPNGATDADKERFGCAACGRAYPKGARFCGGCGGELAPLPTPTRYGCEACTLELPEDQAYCTGCGSKLKPW